MVTITRHIEEEYNLRNRKKDEGAGLLYVVVVAVGEEVVNASTIFVCWKRKKTN